MWKLLTSEPGIRLGCFGGVLAAMAVWEILAPRRPRTVGKPVRWVSNLGLVFLNSGLLRLVAPLGLVGVAASAETRGWGLFQNVALPYWLQRGGRGHLARSGHLPATRDVSRGPAVLATAHGPPRRPGLRRDHGRAVPYAGDSALVRDQGRGGVAARGCPRVRVSLRGAIERHVDVQPRQRADTCPPGSSCCAAL